MRKLKCLNCDSLDCPRMDPNTVMSSAELESVCALYRIGLWLMNFTYEVQQMRQHNSD